MRNGDTASIGTNPIPAPRLDGRGPRRAGANPTRPRAGSKARRVLGGIAALAVFLGSAAAATWVATWLFRLASRLPADVLQAVAAAAVVLLAARVASSGRSRALKLSSDLRRRERRAGLYAELIEIWGSALAEDAGPGDLEARRDRTRTLWPLEQQLLLDGSSNVVRRYVALKEAVEVPGPEADAFLGQLASAMRRDLSEPISRVAPEALARLAKAAR